MLHFYSALGFELSCASRTVLYTCIALTDILHPILWRLLTATQQQQFSVICLHAAGQVLTLFTVLTRLALRLTAPLAFGTLRLVVVTDLDFSPAPDFLFPVLTTSAHVFLTGAFLAEDLSKDEGVKKSYTFQTLKFVLNKYAQLFER